MDGRGKTYEVDYEAIQKRVIEIGTSATKLSRSIGKSRTWIWSAKAAGTKQPAVTLKKISIFLDGTENFTPYIKQKDENGKEQKREEPGKGNEMKPEPITEKTQKEDRCDPKKEYRIDLRKLEEAMAEKEYDYMELAEEIGQEEDYFNKVLENSGMIKGALLNYICLILGTEFNTLLYTEPEVDEKKENESAEYPAGLETVLEKLENIGKNNAKEFGLIKAKLAEEETSLKALKKKTDKTYNAVMMLMEMMRETLRELENREMISSNPGTNEKDTATTDQNDQT